MVKTFLLLVANTVVALGEYSLSILNKYKIASYIASLTSPSIQNCMRVTVSS